jgi:hypothetical protein
MKRVNEEKDREAGKWGTWLAVPPGSPLSSQSTPWPPMTSTLRRPTSTQQHPAGADPKTLI